MKGKFNTIKKSRKKSKDIDEKIEYLNKECQKTGLNEIANSTDGVYQGTTSNPNSGYAEITGKNFNGKGFAMSGDSNLGQGNFGGASIRASDGAALSPPHPVTGEIKTTSTKGGISPMFKLAIPGERPTPDSRMTGPIMWYWNPSGGGGSGTWESLEYNSAAVHGNQPYPFGGDNAGWGYWGSNFMGFPLLRSDGAAFASLFNTIDNFDPKDSIPFTTVFTKDRLDDPSFIPIDVAKRFIAGLLGLAKEGFEYLRSKSPAGFFDIGIDAFTDLVAGALGVGNAKDTYDGYVDKFLPDLAKGKNPPGSSKDNPKDPYADGMNDETKNDWEDIFKEYQNELESGVPPNLAKVPKNYQDIANKNGDIGNITGTPDTSATVDDGFEDNGDGTTTFHKAYDFDGIADMTIQAGNPLVNIGTFGYGVYKGAGTSIVTSPEFDIKKPLKSGKSPTMHIGITFDNKTGKVIPNYKSGGIKESLDESVKLGHFDPEVLNVDINDIRKGIMPEFPKDPPKMINGYSAKSRLAPKDVKGEPFIKVTKKDLAALHILKDSEIKELLQQVDLINAYLKNNPADLIYAQQRYPKDDIRLAQLNWKMDQMKAASDEYMETHFPENQKLFSKLQDKIIKNISQTDPKNFTGHAEAPKFNDDHLEMNEQKKKIMIKHFKKPVKIKKLFRKG